MRKIFKRGGEGGVAKAGFTFVEIVLAATLLAIAIPPLLHLFAETTVTAAGNQVLPSATNVGTGFMEEVLARRFDELSSKDADGNWSTSLGVDAGETITNKTTFDDVDDFDGWAETFVDPAADGYGVLVSVDYVASGDLDTALAIPGPVPDGWTPSYKRVVVSVTHLGLDAPIEMATIVTEVQSL